MAYADTMRTPTATLEQIATLIEGIGSSGYPLNWTSYVPTLGAGGAMTITGTSISYAKYIQIGKLILLRAQWAGTLGGSASNYVTITPPLTMVSTAFTGSAYQIGSSFCSAMCAFGSTTQIQVYKYDNSNYALAATSFAINLMLEVP